MDETSGTLSCGKRWEVIPFKEAKGHLKRARTSDKRECGKRYGTRVLRVRNPCSSHGSYGPSSSMGKPCTGRRGNLRNQARGHPLTKMPRVGVIELSIERGA